MFCSVVVGGGGVVDVVPNFDVVVQATSKVDLRFLVKEVEFGWWGGVVVCGCAKSFSCPSKLS